MPQDQYLLLHHNSNLVFHVIFTNQYLFDLFKKHENMNLSRILLIVLNVASECPEGWNEYLTNQKCYKAFESGKEATWTLAESNCQRYGGDLVSFENEGEKNYVYEKVINRRDYDYYWIGLNNIADSKKYEWISTQGLGVPPVDWTFWSDGLDPVGHQEPSVGDDQYTTSVLSVSFACKQSRN